MAILAAVATMATLGCTGSGTAKIVPVMRSDFTDQEPLIQNIRASEAYWWIGDDQQVNVALKFHADSLLGRGFELDWQLSLVLEGLPAGSSRLYNLKPDSVRVVQTYGADQRRSRGWMGVAVLHAPQGSHLSGRFHANVRQQQFGLLTGWSPPSFYQAPMLVVVGEFDAVQDAKRGRAIRQETEAPGFERSPPTTRPTTRPVSRPATSSSTGPILGGQPAQNVTG